MICWLTELKCCREDLVVQKDYSCCLKNLSFTATHDLLKKMMLNRAPWLITIRRNHLASCLNLAMWNHINSPVFGKLCMLPLKPFGWGSTFLAIVTSSFAIVLLLHYIQLIIISVSDFHDCDIMKTSLQCKCSGDCRFVKSENMWYCGFTSAFLLAIIFLHVNVRNQYFGILL